VVRPPALDLRQPGRPLAAGEPSGALVLEVRVDEAGGTFLRPFNQQGQVVAALESDPAGSRAVAVNDRRGQEVASLDEGATSSGVPCGAITLSASTRGGKRTHRLDLDADDRWPRPPPDRCAPRLAARLLN
jgi:hypothetical protein